MRNFSAEHPVALFLDFDGTLVDLAPTPEGIVVSDDLADGLAKLSDRLDGRLALISGRVIADLERHCGSLTVACGGSHGAELRAATGQMLVSGEPLPAPVLQEVSNWALPRDILVEAKAYGIALHTRTRPAMEGECALYLEQVARRSGLAVKLGKRVAELIRPGADKGEAVRRFMAEMPFAGALPIFVGDDLTDEDGFEACSALGGFGVVVGDRPSQAALHRLDNPKAVREWLEL
ncbi:hypothetical protein AAW00_09225 [Aurantiacibacter luteus]|uniref:Trehalose 6-phosphate phosphatase n=1 Tax=Aurantiacibacter luteus TaxID=1581420 RepID=A0A0G9MWD4_9SPHN|nr:hypothetical protein AAW00_09225 [Aurantiacibacter luteus]